MARASWQINVLARMDLLEKNVKLGIAMVLQEMLPMYAQHTDNALLHPIASATLAGLVMIVIHPFALTRQPILCKHAIMVMEAAYFLIHVYAMQDIKAPNA